jgi:hypothetical protein
MRRLCDLTGKTVRPRRRKPELRQSPQPASVWRKRWAETVSERDTTSPCARERTFFCARPRTSDVGAREMPGNAKGRPDEVATLQRRRVCKINRASCKLGFRPKRMSDSDIYCRSCPACKIREWAGGAGEYPPRQITGRHQITRPAREIASRAKRGALNEFDQRPDFGRFWWCAGRWDRRAQRRS